MDSLDPGSLALPRRVSLQPGKSFACSPSESVPQTWHSWCNWGASVHLASTGRRQRPPALFNWAGSACFWRRRLTARIVLFIDYLWRQVAVNDFAGIPPSSTTWSSGCCSFLQSDCLRSCCARGLALATVSGVFTKFEMWTSSLLLAAQFATSRIAGS